MEKQIGKVLILTGLVSLTLFKGNITAYASESGAYLYGNEIAAISGETQEYFAIVVGDSDGIIDRNELTLDIGNNTFGIRSMVTIGNVSGSISTEDYGNPIPELKKQNGKWLSPQELMNDTHGYNVGVALEFLISKNSIDKGMTNELGVVKLPDGVNVSKLSAELQKYVIYAKDVQEKQQGWKYDERGWRYANGDGTYLVNQWKEIDGKYYYFGEVGYMLAGTRTPDGYYVGSNGEWVENRPRYKV